MKYSFGDIFNADMYEKTLVMFVFGKHVVFNNIVCDELKRQCEVDDTNWMEFGGAIGIADEFGVDLTSEDVGSTSINIDTFFDVVGTPSINGRWFCRTELSTLTNKQKDRLKKYMAGPSENGLLVITSTNWKDYNYYLKDRTIKLSTMVNCIELSFPRRDTLKKLVSQMVESHSLSIGDAALDFFLTRMSQAYDEYEEVINNICEVHTNALKSGEVENVSISIADLKQYMKGIEHYVLDDLIYELVKPLSSDKTNNKKILRMLIAIEDSMTAKIMLYNMLKEINILINFRVLINSGIIPIKINYFYNDVMKMINDKFGENNEFSKYTEYTFKKKAYLASLTSLRDWEYIKIILLRALRNNKLSEEEMEIRCRQAMYEVCVRSVLTESRLDNIIGIDNILNKSLKDLDAIRLKD